jgi:uncharacterized spore protein YtfJ
MSVNRVFDLIEEARESANWRSAFGEPQQVEGATLIPVAQVGYGFGVGFGLGARPGEAHDPAEPAVPNEGGGGGGGASSRPLGTIVVYQGQVSFESTADEGKIVLAGLAVGALALWELTRTLRAIFGRR